MGMQAAGWMDSFVLPQHDGVSSTFASSPSSLFSRKFLLYSAASCIPLPPTKRHGPVQQRELSKEADADANALGISRGNENFRRLWSTDISERPSSEVLASLKWKILVC